ncbi:metallophosphoesterase [Agrococcus casei]|uniref:metallophosphoesterase n=1 Tax=Agrococcus casei TaxID=343512 RepID=UPI003F8E55E1
MLGKPIRSSVAAVTALAVAGALLIGGEVSAQAQPQQPNQAQLPQETHLGKQHYTAEFHSHTSLSDGQLMPIDAFNHVENNTDLDFFGITEHDVTYDIRNTDDFIGDWRDAESAEWKFAHQEAADWNSQPNEMQALIGEEVTWYNNTGHMNIFNADWRVTAKSEGSGGVWGTGNVMYDQVTVFARLGLDPEAIGMFNHPASSHGDWDGFAHLTPQADASMQLIEYKSVNYFDTYVAALDAGWHVAPTWSGDDHRPTWGTGNAALTGVWAEEQTIDGLYDAMRDRSVYASFDDNAQLMFEANEQMMGSILPADTAELDLKIALTDADGEALSSVVVYTNEGKAVHEFDVAGATDFETTVDAADGDYFWVKAIQEDGDELISAPAWVGETTAGTNFAPEITVAPVAETAAFGDTIALPEATATDDSNVTPSVEQIVYNSAGEVAVTDGAFEISSYTDHFIVTKSTDALGSTSAEMQRIQVAADTLDVNGVFQYGTPSISVGATEDSAGASVLTDPQIEQTWAQVKPVGVDWGSAKTVENTSADLFEMNVIGTEAADYYDQITGQPLRSQEFTFDGLEAGTEYEFRFGVSPDGPWTDARGTFAGPASDENAPVYVMGDLQVSSQKPEELDLFNQTLEQVKAQQPGGTTMVQVGDFVDNAGRGEYWYQLGEEVIDELGLRVAPMVGNHETYGDKEFNLPLSPERNAIFSGMFNTPKNGSEIGESNYSFDEGDIHFSVINSNYDLQTQLDWLVDDMRATDKTWKVVLGHFSYFGGSHASDAGMSSGRASVSAALEQLGVDLYIAGHDHVYKRSDILDGALITDAEKQAEAVRYVTMGSSGPKFYDNTEYWWDDVVEDRDIQMGSALQVTDAGLTMSTYTIDGETVDAFTLAKPAGTWRMSSADIEDGALNGLGFLSYEGARDGLTAVAATYDVTGTQVLESRALDVELDHSGGEQFLAFDEPMTVESDMTLRVFLWDSLASGVPLQEAEQLRTAVAGDGTAEDPYEITSWADFETMKIDPAGHFALMNDLELDGSPREQLGDTVPFSGVFDGQGHTITGYAPAEDATGAGLFVANEGEIRDLGLSVGDVAATGGTAGILVDYNTGLIERVWTAGNISGNGRIGGIVGDSEGVVQDSYSLANVHSTKTEAGGVVGVGLTGSTTANVYSTGNVSAAARNVGGVVGYGYTETRVENVMSLNATVMAPQYAHAVVGRVLAGNVADLTNNMAVDSSYIAVESLADAPAADNLKGHVVTAEAAAQQATYSDQLGWDFESVWAWDAELERPVLQQTAENVTEQKPDAEQNEHGFYELATADDLQLIDAFPTEKFVLTADIDLSSIADWSPLALYTPFQGVLDGAGHSISGLTSTQGGLIAMSLGEIRDLGVVDANVVADRATVGLIANASHGVNERVYSTGSIEGQSRVGGLFGDLGGTLTDGYSTADVHTRTTEAGGLVGVALAGSETSTVYATGDVTAGTRNIGGVVGYAYTGTVIDSVIALGDKVTASSYAHRVIGRVLGGDTATLDNLWAVETLEASVVSNTDAPAATNWMGATATAHQARDTSFYTGQLGFDFDTVWEWNSDAQRPTLLTASEDYTGEPEPPLPPEPQPDLEQDADGFYLIETADDLQQVTEFSAESYRLAGSIDLTGVTAAQLAPSGFTGVFDGAGHQLTGYSSVDGGLFKNVVGTVRDLGLADASVTTTIKNVGLLADNVDGLVERVWTSGQITGPTTVGGVVGYLNGEIRDSYSLADVTANAGRQAGGVAGITGRGSITERVYATGAVEVEGNMNAGGVSGYSYEGTTIRGVFALNSSVTASSYAHRVVARELGTENATLENNYAVDTTVMTGQSLDEEGPESINGEAKTAAEAQDQATWSDGLGWDFDSIWQWNDSEQRPMLQTAGEGK